MGRAEGLACLSRWCLNLASLRGRDACGGFQVDKSAMCFLKVSVVLYQTTMSHSEGGGRRRSTLAEDDNEDKKRLLFLHLALCHN